MKAGPDIAGIASLIGDPARANMLSALLSGQALTAGELALEAGVMPQTASAHLAKLSDGRLILSVKQGRHRYFRLANAEVAEVLERLLGLAAASGRLRARPGPREPALRKARVCYDHLAGELGVALFEGLHREGRLLRGEGGLTLSAAGRSFARDFGLPLEALEKRRRPLCRECLDWSQRQSHLAGALAAAFLERFLALGWTARLEGSRALLFSEEGERQFLATFG